MERVVVVTPSEVVGKATQVRAGRGAYVASTQQLSLRLSHWTLPYRIPSP